MAPTTSRPPSWVTRASGDDDRLGDDAVVDAGLDVGGVEEQMGEADVVQRTAPESFQLFVQVRADPARTMMGNRHVVEMDTKSLAGERTLPLPAPVLAALKSFKAAPAEERLAAGEAYTDTGFVLVHETGEAFTIKQLRRRAYRLMEILDLRRVRLCDARASCLTYLANSGVPDHILARWAGHTNVQTTKRWYVKPDVEDLREAAVTWDGLHGTVAEGDAWESS
jgi:hypothetical protein